MGSSLFFRTGLDGATNHVGILSLKNIGEHSAAIRFISVALLIYLTSLIWSNKLKISFQFISIVLLGSIYLVLGFSLNQWAQIHYYVYDIFLIPVTTLLIFSIIPYFEINANNKGLIILFLSFLQFAL